MDYKSLITSKTFWSVVLNVVLKIVGLFYSVTVDEESMSMAADSMVALSSFGISFVFDIGAIYGRIVANKPINRIR